MPQAAGYRERTAQSSQRAVGAALPLRVTDRFRGRVTDRPTRVREEIALRSRKIPRPLARSGVPGPDMVRDSLAIPSLIIDRDRRQSAKKQRNTDVQHIHHTRPADPYETLTVPGGWYRPPVSRMGYGVCTASPDTRAAKLGTHVGTRPPRHPTRPTGPGSRRRPRRVPVLSDRTREWHCPLDCETDSQRRGLSLSPTLSPLSLSLSFCA